MAMNKVDQLVSNTFALRYLEIAKESLDVARTYDFCSFVYLVRLGIKNNKLHAQILGFWPCQMRCH
jgi:hypothetical protein